MPLYEFECQSCHRPQEILVRRPDEQPACPSCQSKQMRRLMSVPAAPSLGGSARSSDLPLAGGAGCEMPRCCGGGCQMD